MLYTILNITALCVGGIGVVLSVRSVCKTLHARKNLSIALKEHMKDPIGELARAVKNSGEHLKKSKMDVDELQKLFQIVERIAYELPSEEQKYIFDGLHQQSFDGRANYLRRMIIKSNLLEQVAGI